MTHHKTFDWQAEALLLLTIVIWGLNFGISKAALAFIPPLVFNALRFSVSAVFLGTIFFSRASAATEWKQFLRSPTRLVLMGLLGHFVYQFGFIEGLFYTTSGNAALILSSTPLWTAISGRLSRTERLNLAGWTGLFVSLVGTLIVVWGGNQQLDFSNETLLGNLLVLAGSVAWGTYTMGSRSFLDMYSPTGFAFITLLCAVPFLWIAAIPSLTEWTNPLESGWAYAAVLYSGLFSVGIAYVLWNQAIRRVGSSHTAIYSNLVPVVALINGFVFLGEPIFLTQLVGGSLVLGGLFWMRKGR